jgi:hypothetical protein
LRALKSTWLANVCFVAAAAAGMELEQYEVKMVPPLDMWITVEPGLSFKR